MTSSQTDRNVVVATGDVTMDWHLTHSQAIRDTREWQEWQEWNPEHCTQMFWERGGAARLADLIEHVAAPLGSAVEIRKVMAPRMTGEISPTDLRYHHSYALWSYFITGKKNAQGRDEGVWRVSRFLGLEKRGEAPLDPAEFWPARAEDGLRLVVLDDAGLGFRDQDPAPWLAPLKGRDDYWILLKMAHPVAQGTLWQYLYEHHASRLIVVVPVHDLRRSAIRISGELSWERTAQDLVWELTYNPKITALCLCAHVIVSFDAAGSFWHTRNRRTLLFHPRLMEGAWGRDHRGGLMGFTSCLVASLAWQILLKPHSPDLAQGINAGLAAMRTLYFSGYQGEEPERLTGLRFPFLEIARVIQKNEEKMPQVEVSPPVSFKTRPGVWEPPAESEPWSILKDTYREDLGPISQKIVRLGLEKALVNVPVGQFEDLTTVDRQEIESFRAIRNLIRDYYCHRGHTIPLSIAVFGPPGSGKSFGIMQVARSILKDHLEKREFNLSQFSRPEELYGAFHQGRDLGLRGKLPLIFWDEFDSPLGDRPLGWLRYFLAPMQDGTFQEGQITHPLGRAIFVFAGSSSSTLEGFSGQDHSDDAEVRHAFRAAKGRDFVSRIKAHVSIKGINPPKVERGGSLPADPFNIIRRAIVLRFLLKRHRPMLFTWRGNREELNIDPGVLKAFLEIGEYRHGVRSMETIIMTSLLQGQRHFERSSLPPEEQLELHVNASEFLDLVQEMLWCGEESGE